jgi:transposase-like protein
VPARALDRAPAMGTIPNIREIPSAARIRVLLICPDCGQENVEFADRLRGTSIYYCTGDGCDYRFDLVGGPRKSFVQGFAEAWRRFYAALTPAS